mmetsp:Transcript_4719/g.10870  ORF Transcript_4719/g.10870 Transcript_4719/m.10870 type:complete len:296 (-) Transcript_4719:135-1022(-)
MGITPRFSAERPVAGTPPPPAPLPSSSSERQAETASTASANGTKATKPATAPAVPMNSSMVPSTAFAATAYTSFSTSLCWIRSSASPNSSSLQPASSRRSTSRAKDRTACLSSLRSTPVLPERLAGKTDSQGTTSSTTSGRRCASRRRERCSRSLRQLRPSSRDSAASFISLPAASTASSTSATKLSGTSLLPISPAESTAFLSTVVNAVSPLPSPGASLSIVSTLTSVCTPSECSSCAGLERETLTTCAASTASAPPVSLPASPAEASAVRSFLSGSRAPFCLLSGPEASLRAA